VKLLVNFYPNSRGGLQAQCKACRREYQRGYRARKADDPEFRRYNRDRARRRRIILKARQVSDDGQTGDFPIAA
jgi:t-SNARE complex subunit (syntaxin)